MLTFASASQNEPRRTRRLALPLLVSLALAGVLALGPVVQAENARSRATIVVNTGDDENNTDGDCSLREAVVAANTNAAVDGCAAGDADGDVITFSDLFFIALDPSLGEITITDDVRIDGSVGGNAAAIDGGGATRIFNVDAAGGAGSQQAVAFRSLSLSNGNSTAGIAAGVSSAPDAGGAVDLKANSEATFTDVLVSFNTAGVNGGGIHGGSGAILTITTTASGLTTISGNDAQGPNAGDGGGGVWGAGTTTISGNVTISDNTASGAAGSGGGVLNFGGVLSITGATISGNTANRAGGGVEDFGDTDRDTDATLTDVTLSGNSIDAANPGNGGGLHSGGGEIVVNGGTVTGNTATEGGGLWSSGTLTVDGTTITGNTGTGDAADNGGGGIYNEDGVLDVFDATISDNRATGAAGSGGGVLNAGGETLLMTSTVSGNTANRAGGGVETTGGALILIMTDATGNDAGANPGNGGAVHGGGVAAIVVGAGTFSGNTAVEGGGLWSSGTLVLTADEADMAAASEGASWSDPMDRALAFVVQRNVGIEAAIITQNEATGDDAAQGGGGLYNEGGFMQIEGLFNNDFADDADEGVVISENVASGLSGSGGGILNNGGTLLMNGGDVVGNRANRAGAGIEDAGGVVDLGDVAVRDNVIPEATANPGNGGGLHSGGGTVTVNGGAFTGNAATEGGGLWSNATLTIQPARSVLPLVSENVGRGAAAANGGGGVYAETGAVVTITSATISDNQATGAAGSGGGILVADGASVSVTLGSITGNQANRAGAGVEVGDDPATAAGSSVSFSQVTVDGNQIAAANPGNGGGLHVGGEGSATVSQSTFSNNTATEGAGLWISGPGSLDLDNSTVSGNAASEIGGGVYDDGGADIALRSVTVANNTAGTDGGGLAQGALATTRTYSFQNTLVGDNTASGQGDDCFGTFQSGGFNLIESTDGCTIVGDTDTNVTGQDPELGPLADNGGPTMTQALGDESPAVDAGQSAFDVDQRGEPRDDGQDDIGAFEAGDDGMIACTTQTPLSFDFDGDGSPTTVMADDFNSTGDDATFGEFAGVRNEMDGGSGDTVDLSTCSFVTFDPFTETVIYSAVTGGAVAPNDVYVLATNGGDQALPSDVLFDNPGAFALVTGTAQAGDPVASVFGRVVAAVVYDRDRDVFGSVGGGATEAEMRTFAAALADVFGQATPTEGGADIDLTVAAWPNPVAGRATVAFGLAEGGAARVSVYDALGREVAVLADRSFASGRHEVTLDGAAFPAGIYVVRVASEGGVQTARLTVAR